MEFEGETNWSIVEDIERNELKDHQELVFVRDGNNLENKLYILTCAHMNGYMKTAVNLACKFLKNNIVRDNFDEEQHRRREMAYDAIENGSTYIVARIYGSKMYKLFDFLHGEHELPLEYGLAVFDFIRGDIILVDEDNNLASYRRGRYSDITIHCESDRPSNDEICEFLKEDHNPFANQLIAMVNPEEYIHIEDYPLNYMEEYSLSDSEDEDE